MNHSEPPSPDTVRDFTHADVDGFAADESSRLRVHDEVARALTIIEAPFVEPD